MQLKITNTFESYLNNYNNSIMDRINVSEMVSTTSTVKDRCVFKYSRDTDLIKQYYRDCLVSISTQDSFTLVKNYFPSVLDIIHIPAGIEYIASFNNEKIIRLIFVNPVTQKDYVTKTYIALNLRSGNMTWDISGNLLTPLEHKWVHTVIDIKYVNSWIKNNMQELVSMRSNNKRLNPSTSNHSVIAYISDIQAYLDNTIIDVRLTRLLEASDFKKLVAHYLKSIGDDRAHINTYFDTYEELEQYRANRLKENK
jgi:hypothetical protein